MVGNSIYGNMQHQDSYAYHISKGSELIIRWGNAPHHKQIRTFPHHKHVGETILESNEVEIEVILKDLERMISGSISLIIKSY